MEWFGDFVLLHGLVVGILLAAYYLGRRRYEPDRNGQSIGRGLLFAAPWMVTTVFFTVMLIYVLAADYRATPVWFFWLWGPMFILLNAAAALRMLWPRWGKISGQGLRDFVNLGGFWGNWWSGKNDQHRPPTTNNFWGTAAFCWAVLLVLSFWIYTPGAMHFDSDDVGSAAKTAWSTVADAKVTQDSAGFLKDGAMRLAKAAATDNENNYVGKTAAAVKSWLQSDSKPRKKAARQPAADTPLSVFPRSSLLVWFLGTFVVVLWAVFANIICRRDGAIKFFTALGNLFRRKESEQPMVVSSTPPATAPAEAGRGKGKHREEAPAGGHPTFPQRLAEEAAAEAIIRSSERGLVKLADRITAWLSKKS